MVMLYLENMLKILQCDDDEYFRYHVEGFEKFKEVDRLDDLIDLISSLMDNEVFHRYATWDKICNKGEEFAFDINKFPFYVSVKEGLGKIHLLPLFVPGITHCLIDLNGFVSLYAVIQISFNTYSGHHLLIEEDKAIKFSDIGPLLTFFVEDYDNLDNKLPEFDESFFKKLRKIYWYDKKAKELDARIYNFLGVIFVFNKLDPQYIRGFQRAVYYLMGCNALKCGRDSISCEDVVVAYLTGFKLILNDIRPLVYELYDGEKWVDESTWK